MSQYTPKLQEEYSAKLPALALLTSLGWSFLSLEQALRQALGTGHRAMCIERLFQKVAQWTLSNSD
ncbi:hypothetical protein ACU6RQ_10705 [Zobellella denitrificans]